MCFILDKQTVNKCLFVCDNHVCSSVQPLYDGKWHQLKLLVRPSQVSGFLDDEPLQEVMLEPVEPIYINGETQVAKRRGTDTTVPVSTKTTVQVQAPL